MAVLVLYGSILGSHIKGYCIIFFRGARGIRINGSARFVEAASKHHLQGRQMYRGSIKDSYKDGHGLPRALSVLLVYINEDHV